MLHSHSPNNLLTTVGQERNARSLEVIGPEELSPLGG